MKKIIGFILFTLSSTVLAEKHQETRPFIGYGSGMNPKSALARAEAHLKEQLEKIPEVGQTLIIDKSFGVKGIKKEVSKPDMNSTTTSGNSSYAITDAAVAVTVSYEFIDCKLVYDVSGNPSCSDSIDQGSDRH